VRLEGAQLCAASTTGGPFKAVAAPGPAFTGPPEPARLVAFVSATGQAGQVAVQSAFARPLYRAGDMVRVLLRLTERGVPLRLARVQARVALPAVAPGDALAAADISRSEALALAEENGDLLPGQAKAELAAGRPAPADREMVVPLVDDGTGFDGQPLDGVYVGQFEARVPGRYEILLQVEHAGLLTPPGQLTDRLATTVLPRLDAQRLRAVAEPLPGLGRLRVTLAPQDRLGQLLGPGQTAALSFYQGDRRLNAGVVDLTDGSYRADLDGIAAGEPLMVEVLGERATLLTPDQLQPDPAGGCAFAGSAAPSCTHLISLFLMCLGLLLGGRGAWYNLLHGSRSVARPPACRGTRGLP
jgi:hypothetical protein